MITLEIAREIFKAVRAISILDGGLDIRLPDQRVYAAIPTQVIQDYLKSHGWRCKGTIRHGQVGIWTWINDRDDEGKEMATGLAHAEHYEDYGQSVARMIQLAADLEKRSRWDILVDMVAERQGELPSSTAARDTAPPTTVLIENVDEPQSIVLIHSEDDAGFEEAVAVLRGAGFNHPVKRWSTEAMTQHLRECQAEDERAAQQG